MDEVDISVILPVFNEEANLEPLVGEICEALGRRCFEIVAVNDASTDGSTMVLKGLRQRDRRVRVLTLDRRTGQSGAILAGIEAAYGRIVAMLDADGQNDPKDLLAMLELVEVGEADGVVGYRAQRADGWWKRVQSRIANVVRNRITGDPVRDTGCSPRVARREDLAQIPRFDGMHRFFPTLLKIEGYSVVQLPVSHRARHAGQSKYGVRNRAMRAFVDLLAVRWMKQRHMGYEVVAQDMSDQRVAEPSRSSRA